MKDCYLHDIWLLSTEVGPGAPFGWGMPGRPPFRPYGSRKDAGIRCGWAQQSWATRLLSA